MIDQQEEARNQLGAWLESKVDARVDKEYRKIMDALGCTEGEARSLAKVMCLEALNSIAKARFEASKRGEAT